MPRHGVGELQVRKYFDVHCYLDLLMATHKKLAKTS